MALVTVALVAIIAMAAVSIDVGTLYQAKAEAQRSADAAALTAARVISISGITGDPTNGGLDGSWAPVCGGAASLATLAAINLAQQNLIAGVAVPRASVSVTYVAPKSGTSNPDCTDLGSDFGVNPIVTVIVQRTKLPIFFARVFSLFNSNYSGASVSATASAEGFNPSKSGSVASAMIPVQPRCVKPWIIPNSDPGNAGANFVLPLDGTIVNQGVSQLGGGVIGETFNLTADCTPGALNCGVGTGMIANPPQGPPAPPPNTARYIPAFVSGNSGAAPSCSVANNFQEAIGGCDQSTVYACGTPLGAQADLIENPVTPTGVTGDTSTAVQCLTNSTVGADSLNATPGTFPLQIKAGSGNPLVQNGLVNNDNIITTSNSIVTIPIYDGATLVGVQPPVTIVGFLQVFINTVDGFGNVNVTVMNVAGCSNAATNPAVTGTSPVPVRLITPP
jgi:hypothetical protein